MSDPLFLRWDLMEEDAELSRQLEQAVTHFRDHPEDRDGLELWEDPRYRMNLDSWIGKTVIDNWSGITWADLLKFKQVKMPNHKRKTALISNYVWRTRWLDTIARDFAEVMLFSQCWLRDAILKFCYIRDDEDGARFVKKHVLHLLLGFIIDLFREASEASAINAGNIRVQTNRTAPLRRQADPRNRCSLGYFVDIIGRADKLTREIVYFSSEEDGGMAINRKPDFIHDSMAMRRFKEGLRGSRRQFICIESNEFS